MKNNTSAALANPQKNCSHGLSLDTPCIFCLHNGVYFRKDAEAYQEFYNRSSKLSFDFAFEIAKRIQFWQENTKDNVLENYFKGLKKTEKLVWSISTIKKAYYLTRDFSDLSQEENRKCPFSIYREIANSKITDSQKQELRAVAELEAPTLYETRELIREAKNLKPIQHKIDPQFKEKIIFTNQEDFISKVQEFVSKQTNLNENQIIAIRILKQKERTQK